MARRDVIHEPVKEALTKAGWRVTEPYRIVYKDMTHLSFTRKRANRNRLYGCKCRGVSPGISE
jgi:hypothetical protein